VPQPDGTGDVIDSSDTRLTQAVAVIDPATGHEGIWTQHTVAGSGGGPAVVRWYELTPATSTPRQIGTLGGPSGSFAFNGAISPTKDGTSAAIFYNSGSSSQLVDMRVQTRRSDTTPGTTIEDLLLATSADIDGDLSCPNQDPTASSCRWGDYAGASPDPSNECLVWGTSMLTVDSPDGFGTPQWGTQNAAINVCGFTLTVTKSGTGSGTVTSNIAGISCGATCSHSYGAGTSVTLTGTPSVGSSFSGWSGACSGTGTCTVSLTQARSVTATFALRTETLSVSKSGSGFGTVSSSPAGVSCGSTCSHAFNYGTSVTLTASPAGGSLFGGWSGACSGTGTCIVTMGQAASVAAKFTLKPACIVPRVKGKKLKVAKRALAKARCKPGKITRKFSKVRKGRVISQKPKPGKHLPASAKVNLVISKGKKP
jgi:PASTA domain/Divergent InlB B-repeat domain